MKPKLDACLDVALDGLVWVLWRIDEALELTGTVYGHMKRSFVEGWYGPEDEVRDMESQDV